MTESPMRMSFILMKSTLWRLARLTVVPATRTGVITAVGVTTPVRPTVHSIVSITVSASSGGNLYAAAHRGAFTVKPNAS